MMIMRKYVIGVYRCGNGLRNNSAERNDRMGNAPIRFTAEMADVPFEVRCFCPETEALLRDYRSDKAPEFVIDLADSECDSVRKLLTEHWDKQPDPFAAYGRSDQEAYIEEETFHWMLDQKLSPYGVFQFHGSAICLDGEAYIFTAPSGTGKSTHTRLWRERFGDRAWMINDDMPYLRIFDDCVRAYGTPWNGKHRLGCNGSAPVKAIAYLRRDAENHIEPLPKETAFAVVMKETFRLPDKAWWARMMGQIKTVLDRIPFYKLRCNMEPEAAEIALLGMKYGELR